MFFYILLITKFIFINFIFFCTYFNTVYAQTPSPSGAKAIIINIKNGDKVKSPLVIHLGLSENMGIAPAMVDWPDSGHFHLLIDKDLPADMSKPISNKIIHLHLGQISKTVNLTKGEHTLQILMGDFTHIPHTPPIMSEKIRIIVE